MAAVTSLPPDDEYWHRLTWFTAHRPWCDTCQQPAVVAEPHGHLHSTASHPTGLPTHLDHSGHDVTIGQWWKTSDPFFDLRKECS